MSYHQPSHIIARVASPTLLQTQLACLGISGDVAAREGRESEFKIRQKCLQVGVASKGPLNVRPLATTLAERWNKWN